MERFYSSQRESLLLGYNNDYINSLIPRSSSSDSNSEVDFTDVFGGPPRRSSVNEARQTVGELSEEEGERGWCRWPPEREKPVFGEDSGNRRRHPTNKNSDFFDDIFGGEASGSVCSTPKKRVGDAFALSRVSSPLPLPPAADPVVGSLPATFSLPAKLTNGVDLPTFGSSTRNRNLSNINDGIVASNGLKPYRQSLLSQEFSNSSTSDKADKGSIMKQNISISEGSPGASNGQFHFSIYKWASKGVPMVMPLRTERNSRNKDKAKLERCSSAKEWIVSEITTQNPIEYNGSPLMNNRKQDVPTTSTPTENGSDSNQIVEQIVSAKTQSDKSSSPQTITKDVPTSSISHDAREVESSTRSTGEIGFSGKTEAAKETQKREPKPLQFLFKESDKKQDNDETITREREENRMKSSKKLSAVFDVTVNPIKQEEKTVPLRDVGRSKAISQGSVSLGENMGKGLVKGKVKEFARIFNQEAVTKPKFDSNSRSQGSTYKKREALRAKNEVEGGPEQSKKYNSATETTNISANILSHEEDISEPEIPDISFTVIGDKDESFHGSFMIQVLAQDEDEVLQNQENQEIQTIDNKIKQWSKGKEGNIRSLLSTLQYFCSSYAFQVYDQSRDYGCIRQLGQSAFSLRVSQLWDNIPALVSVLWPECGWKYVPLVDIIEGNAVKRSYQRALLCLHPDKLQQKGASSDQKYIAEKVFDILQCEVKSHIR
ncbi:J domain-containing protein required for chloroplast accumulation response 1 isoform X3 [Glycine max]|uniref:J domain-containing protein required for chloroplast accumulation response 1 isoform X3 n=1 Tax=Glycine max TaxID=3847 RepID=UPI00071923B3|nr:J domain-containing protein required for chloroplast accumulation response 1 isoform X3 [Glycine max]|eukprot:XP_014632712.1 J domain-containing protein required for chloroplast accumulation response 1 isoform X3 [Glycine max]